MAGEIKALFKKLFPNAKVGASILSAVILGISLLASTIMMSPDKKAWAFDASILVLGACVGWLLGIVASPYDPSEKKQFSEFTKAVSVFRVGLSHREDRQINGESSVTGVLVKSKHRIPCNNLYERISYRTAFDLCLPAISSR